MRGAAYYRCVHITARSAVAACLICALTKSAAADFDRATIPAAGSASPSGIRTLRTGPD